MTKLFAKLLTPWSPDASPYKIGRLAPLLQLVPPQVPPVGLLARIEEELDRLELRIAAPRKVPAWWPILLLPAGLTGVVAGAAGLALVALPQLQVTCPAVRLATMQIAASQIESGSAGIGVDSIECGRYLRLSHTGMRAAYGQALELWLIPQGGGAPRSLGLVAAKGDSTIVPVSMTLMTGDTLAVSRETASGSPKAEPSGPVLATAKIGKTR